MHRLFSKARIYFSVVKGKALRRCFYGASGLLRLWPADRLFGLAMWVAPQVVYGETTIYYFESDGGKK